MKCLNYQAESVELIRAISQHTSLTLQTLLFETDSLPINNTTINIFEAVPTYILDAKRF